MGRILIPPVTQLSKLKWLQLFHSVQWEKKFGLFDLKSWITLVELRQKHLKWKKKHLLCWFYPTGNGQSSIIAKAVNKQNTSQFLLYKLYFKMILKMILKSFDFQCDFGFSYHHFQNDFDFKSPLFRWFDFKIINIWWFCPSLHMSLWIEL